MGLAPIAVYGHNGGAVVVLELVLRHPNLVRGAVLHEPPMATVLDDPATAMAHLDSALRQAQRGTRAMYAAFVRAQDPGGRGGGRGAWDRRRRWRGDGRLNQTGLAGVVVGVVVVVGVDGVTAGVWTVNRLVAVHPPVVTTIDGSPRHALVPPPSASRSPGSVNERVCAAADLSRPPGLATLPGRAPDVTGRASAGCPSSRARGAARRSGSV